MGFLFLIRYSIYILSFGILNRRVEFLYESEFLRLLSTPSFLYGDILCFSNLIYSRTYENKIALILYISYTPSESLGFFICCLLSQKKLLLFRKKSSSHWKGLFSFSIHSHHEDDGDGKKKILYRKTRNHSDICDVYDPSKRSTNSQENPSDGDAFFSFVYIVSLNVSVAVFRIYDIVSCVHTFLLTF